MKKVKSNLSIKRIILLIFVIALFISVTLSGALIFTNWIASAQKRAERIANTINEDIYNQVYRFMQVPYHINEINHKIIENGMLNLSDQRQRDRFFVEVLGSHNQQIYSFSYGTETGEYYGARRNENAVTEIMINNADTKGNSWYYFVNEDLTAGERVLEAGQFDPRSRAWYKAAVESDGPTFSPTYKHFVMNDLTISAAWPIHNQSGEIEGVLGTHLLLSDIGAYLKGVVDEYNGNAIIFEKNSSDLIANSFDMADFTVLQDGTFKRYGLEDIENRDLQNAYGHYETNPRSQQIYKGENDNFFVNTREIQMNGIDWIVMSAIPESIFMTDIKRTIGWIVLIIILSLIGSVFIYSMVMKKYLKPMKTLLQVSGELSSGDLSKRVPIVRNDEIGEISKSFNCVADKMQSLISNLDATVQERTQELQKVNLALKDNKEEFRLILDSAVEGIYGIDLNGNCTFCNKSAIKMLGYQDQTDLLGKNMHNLIHHSWPDGTAMMIEACKIIQSFRKGEGSHVDDEVLWRADGTFFKAEYYSYPQIKNGEIIGAVITFTDISDRKQKEAKIQYLASFDALTGLQNRGYFDQNRIEIDKADNLPLAVIFVDINGLKMTNDIFGHAAGDELIIKSSKILKQACRENDIVARVGGDEFIILLPKTTTENAEKILARMRSELMNVRVKAIKCSISFGLDTKESFNQGLDEVIANAENKMYKEKTMNRNTINKDMINTLIETFHSRNPIEKEQALAVSELSAEIGSALDLPETEIRKLKQAGYLHNIGKIGLDDELLSKDCLSEEDLEKLKLHPSIGYRILNLFDDTLHLAEYVYGQDERWDGSGYPRGLKKQEIPLIARIISVAQSYDQVLNRSLLAGEELTALESIKRGSGTRFDPEIVARFIQMIGQKEAELMC